MRKYIVIEKVLIVKKDSFSGVVFNFITNKL